ncbi:ABC transporter permease [Thalassoglobus sp. JC818]|uniref:ABC transporter permease n=1 Tax=Thalassoglobus sp. JC818 TaxID=3232136 RepID=UPI00345A6034
MTEPQITELKSIPKSPSFWKEAWRQFRQRKLAMLSLGFVLFLSIVALFAPAISGSKPIVCKYKGEIYFPMLGYYSPRFEATFLSENFFGNYHDNLKENDPDSWAIWPLHFSDPNRPLDPDEWPGYPRTPQSSAPNSINWFGTDSKATDVFSQMVHGTRTALLVGFVSMGIASVIGITLGGLAGYFGGWTDSLISRLIEVVMCIPTLVLILALVAVINERTIWHMMAVIGATGWTGIARLTRAEFLKLKTMDFVSAARVLGVGHIRIMFKYLLPNALAPVLVPITFGIAAAILIESALSFLGFGPANSPSWGKLLNSGRQNLEDWWLILFPGFAIFLTVLAYNLIGEGLQEATDPRLRDSGSME